MNQRLASVRFGQLPAFQAENTEVLGISANAAIFAKSFADFAKINYPLLSDRDGKMMHATAFMTNHDESPNGPTSSSIKRG